MKLRIGSRPIAAIAAAGMTLFAAATILCHAQIITTVAGGGVGDGGPASGAAVQQPNHITVDAAGNVFFADLWANRVRRIDATTGFITTYAGTGAGGFSGDGGLATAATLWFPAGIAFDSSGNGFILETYDRVVRRVDAATGVITTIAGSVVLPALSYGDGLPATQASFAWPIAIAVDAAGNVYVADHDGHRVRRISAANGIITTFAGGGGGGDGSLATDAAVSSPSALAFDASGNLYIAENNSRVRKVDAATGIISTVAGTASTGFGGDGGPATSALLNGPVGLALDAAGNLFIADRYNGRVRRVDAASGLITTVAAGITYPNGVGVDAAGRIYASSGSANYGGLLWRVEPGLVTLVTGSVDAFSFIGDGLPATGASLSGPKGIALDSAGNLFIADSAYNGSGGRVRRVDAVTSVITTIAGGGAGGDGGPATAANINPGTVAVDKLGNVYVGDPYTKLVHKVTAGTGIITVYAGNGTSVYTSDGAAATSTGITPNSLAVDSIGNLYIGDASGPQAVRKVAPGSGIVTTVASQIGAFALAVDASDNLYIGGSNGAIAKVAAGTGIVSIVRPGGLPVYALAFDPQGNMYTSEGDGAPTAIRRTFAANGLTTTIVTSQGYSFYPIPLGDGGPVSAASVGNVPGLVFRAGDGLLLIDAGHVRIRKITFPPIEASPQVLSFDARLPQTTALARRVTIINGTTGAIAIGPISVSGAAFAETHDCGASLAGGATCNVDVTFTPPAVGPVTGTLTVNAASGAQPVALSGAGELSLVSFYYQSILRRSPDAQGKQFWDSERTRMQGLGANVNETWFALSSFFFASGEYSAFNRDATGFTTDLYKTFFNRVPDAQGQQFWLDQMANGMPREVVLAAFQLSPEFKAFAEGYFGNTAARAEVDMVMDFYRGLLGRLPDNSGFTAWVSNMRSAQCDANPATAVAAMAVTISESFATSDEYVNKNRSNAQYVGDLYNAFLRRGGDLASVVTWINSLSGTFTRKQLRDNFRASAEFQARVQAVVSQGCVS